MNTDDVIIIFIFALYVNYGRSPRGKFKLHFQILATFEKPCILSVRDNNTSDFPFFYTSSTESFNISFAKYLTVCQRIANNSIFKYYM